MSVVSIVTSKGEAPSVLMEDSTSTTGLATCLHVLFTAHSLKIEYIGKGCG